MGAMVVSVEEGGPFFDPIARAREGNAGDLAGMPWARYFRQLVQKSTLGRFACFKTDQLVNRSELSKNRFVFSKHG